MRNVYLTNTRDLIAFLEAEIAAGRNPKTPSEWEAFIERMRCSGRALNIGLTNKTPEELKRDLTED